MNMIDADAQARAVDAYHRIYYDQPHQTWSNTRWMGHAALKCPLDMWVYQEIIFETKPDLIIETGTYSGGSALFMAMLLDCMASMAETVERIPRRIVSIDIESKPFPQHLRVEYWHQSSTAPETIASLKQYIQKHDCRRVMAILDSDHRAPHVAEELRLIGPLVSTGCYCIVEDTNVNGHPVYPDFGPGPTEAVRQYLDLNDDFEIDRSREKYMMTFNPSGYLLKR